MALDSKKSRVWSYGKVIICDQKKSIFQILTDWNSKTNSIIHFDFGTGIIKQQQTNKKFEHIHNEFYIESAKKTSNFSCTTTSDNLVIINEEPRYNEFIKSFVLQFTQHPDSHRDFGISQANVILLDSVSKERVFEIVKQGINTPNVFMIMWSDQITEDIVQDIVAFILENVSPVMR